MKQTNKHELVHYRKRRHMKNSEKSHKIRKLAISMQRVGIYEVG